MEKNTLAIFHKNFSDFDFIKFRISKLEKHFKIEYVNLSIFLNNKSRDIKKVKNKKFIYINSLHALYKYFSLKKNILVLDLLGINFRFKLNIIRIFINYYSLGILPVLGLRYRISNKYVSKSLKGNIIKFTNYLNKLIFKTIVFKNYCLVLSGKYREKFYLDLIRKKCVFYTHSADYQKYLDINKNYICNTSYSVFLEENLTNHPDYYNSSQGFPSIGNKEYYDLMDKFFAKFQKTFNCKIIIAAHPKSSVNKIRKNFKKYKIFYGKTENLIKNSTFVITHASTSISYPVIFKKPIYFINFEKIKNDFVGREIDMTSKLLNSNLLYIDKKYNLNNSNFKINKKKYDLYKRDYLLHPKNNKYTFDQILINNFEKNKFKNDKK